MTTPTPTIMNTTRASKTDDSHVPVSERPLEEQVEYWRRTARRYEKRLRAYKRDVVDVLLRGQDRQGGRRR